MAASAPVPAAVTASAPADDGVPEDAIAVIGVSGRYPMAEDLDAFWHNLAEGRDCVTEVPADRWDHSAVHHPEPGRPGRTYGRWGGFLDDVDRFDPLFFSISPREAELMDPQARLFLETSWHALEDAGYRASALRRRKVGVFVGVMYGDYQFHGALDALHGGRPVTESSYSLIANRVSYALDLNGPSMAVDTMCSSSLTAIHLACRSLRSGESELAVAGGVNVSVHPYKYVLLGQSRFLSEDGRCRAFGAGGTGYVPGEGVGAVLLKPYRRALEDGDHIHGVILAESVNHGGRPSGNGLTVPNPRAQAELVAQTLRTAGTDARTISYVEAHGTGTALGDPIEITGLTKAYRDHTADTGFCSIGSVKSSIGHLESAAGIAGLTKVLLQFRHGRIAPTLHAEDPNPHIDFPATPFTVCREAADWARPVIDGVEVPRRAGLSSFGAGGSNAHLVLQEPGPAPAGPGRPAAAQLLPEAEVFVLSARDTERLRAYAGRLSRFLDRESVALADVAHTLWTGREQMTERLAVVTRDGAELARLLREFAEGGRPEGLLAGRAQETVPEPEPEPEPELEPEPEPAPADPARAARAWVAGTLDATAHNAPRGRRVPLPCYPFARERHWIDAPAVPPAGRPAPLHPLLDENESTLDGVRFRKRFTADDPLLRDHVVSGRPLLAAATTLELVRAAAERAGTRPPQAITDVTWGLPVTVDDAPADVRTTLTADGDHVAFEVYTGPETSRTVHLRGRVRYDGAPAGNGVETADLAAVRARCALARPGEEVYRHYAEADFAYGPGFRVMREVWSGRQEALALLELPVGAGHGCELEPALLDGALRTCHWIDRATAPAAADLAVPFSAREVRIHEALQGPCYAHAERTGGGEGREQWRYRVRVLDASGRELVRVEGLEGRLFGRPADGTRAAAAPGGGTARVSAPVPDVSRTEPPAPGAWHGTADGPAGEEVRFWTPVWREAPVPPAGRTDDAVLLVFAARPGDADRLAASGDWRRVAEVLPGREFADRGQAGYTLDPEDGTHYVRLLDAVRTPGTARLDVAHLWATEAPRQAGPAVDDLAAAHRDRDAVLARGLLSVAHLLRAADGRPVRVAYVHEGTSSAGVPEHEAVAGLARSTAPCAPRAEVFTLRFAPGETGESLPRVAAELAAAASRRGDEVRHTAGRRTVRTAEPAPVPAPVAPPLTERGVYVVSGGNGGVAGHLARRLAERYRARLVLLGRSGLSGPARRGLEELGAEVLAVRADVADPDQVRAALVEARGRFGRIDGVFHLAGVADRTALTRSDDASFRAALAAKTRGLVNLDVLTRGDELDFFVAFSSVSSWCGDFGAGSYAAANRFLDAATAARAAGRDGGARPGRSLSLAWPLWAAGGVDTAVSASERARYRDATGMRELTPEEALDALDLSWSYDAPVLAPVAGDPDRVRRTLGGAPSTPQGAAPSAPRGAAPSTPQGNAPSAPPAEAPSGPAGTAPAAPLSEAPARPAPTTPAGDPARRHLPRLVAHLRQVLSRVLKLPADRIDATAQLDAYGIDSVMIMEANSLLSADFPGLRGTLLFEYRTVEALAGHLAGEHAADVVRLFGAEPAPDAVADPPRSPAVRPAPAPVAAARETPAGADEPIAIIGMSGRYPKARNLTEFWDNLVRGRDCVTEVPAGRWDVGAHYDPDPDRPGRTYGRWGGFLDDVDAFDSLFFAISPMQAKSMDPQERLFLETAWAALEDAGYRLGDLPRPRYGDEGRDVGVYVGVMWDDYAVLGAEESFKGNHVVAMANRASIANQVSYFGDFRGPSVVVDTACSASLVALHQACESLRRGECAYAIAGGVNVSAHPLRYVHLSRKKMLAADGRCRSFGAGGTGYVPGEGVGAVVLKPLSRALADGDQVHAVIRATAVNHGGRTNGFTVPNPNAQRALVNQALDRAGVDARTISCVEAHGTGTALGDPIEHTALTQAFAAHTEDRGFCALGSVKSAIGHLEGAAGVAGLTKAVLQLKHGRLVPSLHADEPNPVIDFENSPFRVQREAAPWPREEGRPRRAAVSSFGAGGTNAHVILEEFVAPPEDGGARGGAREVIVLSARDEERLRAYAADLAAHLTDPAAPGTLAEIAHTLQTGREAMTERLALLADDRAPAAAALAAYSRGEEAPGLLRGSARQHGRLLGDLFTDGAGARDFVAALGAAGQWDRLASLWVSGVDLDWPLLRTVTAGGTPRKVSLPTYPFARERHWLPVRQAGPAAAQAAPPAGSGTDGAAEHEVRITLRPQDAVVADHTVSGATILPGTGYLDLVLDALGARTGDRVVDDVYWLAPVVVGDEQVELRVVSRPGDRGTAFEVLGATAVHARGRLTSAAGAGPAEPRPVPGARDLARVRAACPRHLDADGFYTGMERLNVRYGPYFRLVSELWTDGEQVLARLALPAARHADAGHHALHPGVLDAALHAVAALHFDTRGTDDPPLLPYAADRVHAHRAVPATGWTHITPVGPNRYDVALLDDEGRVCLTVSGLAVREQRDTAPQFTYRPRWTVREAAPDGTGPRAERVLIVGPAAAAPLSDAIAARHPRARVDRLTVTDDGLPAEALDAGQAGRPAPDTVYFLAGFPGAPDPVRDPAAGRAPGVLALLRLVRAVLARRGPEVRLKVVTARAYALREQDTAQPWAAALLGLCSALEKEEPSVRTALVDVAGDDPEREADRVVAEPMPAQVHPVLVRHGVRYVRRLEPLRLPRPARPVLRRGGVYAIVGGLGVLGSDTALHLATHYGARLLLVGRATPDERRRAVLARIEEAGGQVEYVRADAADPRQVRAAVERAKERFGALHGVFHSVMDFRTAPLADLAEADLHACLDAKEATLLGTWEAVCEEDLDFLVHYSSGAGFLGAAGQGGYAAACCLADATALGLARGARFPVKVVNWGFWHAAGIAEREEMLRTVAASGALPIGAAEGMAALERSLAQSCDQIVAVRASDRLLSAMGVEAGAESRPRRRELAGHLGDLDRAVPLSPDERAAMEEHQRASRAAENLARLLLVGALRRMGVLLGEGERYTEDGLRERLGVAPQYHRLLACVVDILHGSGHLRRTGAGEWVSTARVVSPEVLETNADPAAATAALIARHPGIRSVATLLERCLEAFPRVVTGAESHMDVLFPGGSMDLVVGVYRANAVSDRCNRIVADSVRRLVEQRLAEDPAARPRILEVGAGTGSTSEPVLAALAPYADRVTYTYTDVTSAFVRHGRKRFAAAHPFAEFRVFDVDEDPVTQGIALDGYDIVLGTNVFHVTPSIEQTMLRIKRLLRSGGVVLANEGTGFACYLPLIFGLTGGWWMYQDTACRIPGSPLLRVPVWRDVLAACGYRDTTVLQPPATAEGRVEQCVILAASDGVVPAGRGAAPVAPAAASAVGPAAQDRPGTPPGSGPASGGTDLARTALDRVTAVFARVLEMPEERFDPDAPFEDYGIDSLVVPELKQALEADFGRLPAPLLFEHTTIARLAAYFRTEHTDTLVRLAEAAPADAPRAVVRPADAAPGGPAQERPGERAVPGASASPAAPLPTEGAVDLQAVVAALTDEQVENMLGDLLAGLGGDQDGRTA
ncbi:SDR family NAD(P)-dependent oxidoreductase [Streptomyces sp. NRRL F-5650]|uniref:SDR family NAD(P)-dependent oxidoreductase n=1 Tax=Streptomyces sp. NRRL F-5650 TaxID=1463868 RepID=UPI002D219442|nr:SDR family NAD(P)-dependent oxidoreductase [Streptomyces sp. NRRL F-5650]